MKDIIERAARIATAAAMFITPLASESQTGLTRAFETTQSFVTPDKTNFDQPRGSLRLKRNPGEGDKNLYVSPIAVSWELPRENAYIHRVTRIA